jgi:hypothetical protein
VFAILSLTVPLLVSRLPVIDKVPVDAAVPGARLPRLTSVLEPRSRFPLPETTPPAELVNPVER